MAGIESQQQKHHLGFFHSTKPEVQPDLSSFSEDIGNLSRRLRLLEESFTNMRKTVEVIEQNMLSKNKLFAKEIKTINSDMVDIKQEIAEIKNRMLEMINELRECAKRDELKVLEKYINFWSPVKYVTQNDVEDIVKEILRKNAAKNTKK